jgi:hypothetical protein
LQIAVWSSSTAFTIRAPTEVFAAGSSPSDFSNHFPADISKRLASDNAQDEKLLQNYISHCRLGHHFESAKELAFKVAEEDISRVTEETAEFARFKDSYDELDAEPDEHELMNPPTWQDEDDGEGEGQMIDEDDEEQDELLDEEEDGESFAGNGSERHYANEDAMDEDEEQFGG